MEARPRPGAGILRAALLAALALMAAWAMAAAPALAEQPKGPGLSVTAASLELADLVKEVVAEAGPKLAALTDAAPARVRIRVAPNLGEFEKWMKDVGGPRWAAGLAMPRDNLILLRSPRQLAEPGEFPFLVVHELSHLYLHAALRGRRAPLWLEEGIAMYAAGEGGMGLAARMTRAVLGPGGLKPLNDLSVSFPSASGQASLAYAQSYYLVAYLLNEYGPETLPRIITELARGREITAALKMVTGKSLAIVEAEFQEAMASRFSWLALFFAGGGLWALAAMVAGVGLVLRRRAHKKRMRAMADVGGPGWPEANGGARINLGEGSAPGRRQWPPPPQRGEVLPPAGLEPRPREPEDGEG